MPMDADYALLKKWSNWFDRKNGSGYGPANILQRRTMNTAIVTVSTLQNIPFTELSSSLYFFCSDIDSKEFSRLYESQVELAGANPDKFIKGLHSFFNSMAKRIKNESEYALFFDFLMAASRGYLRFDVFSHKTLFSGGNENHACVLCEKRTSPR